MGSKSIMTEYQQLLKSVEEAMATIKDKSMQSNLIHVQELVQKADHLHTKADKSTDVLLLDAEVNRRENLINYFF